MINRISAKGISITVNGNSISLNRNTRVAIIDFTIKIEYRCVRKLETLHSFKRTD